MSDFLGRRRPLTSEQTCKPPLHAHRHRAAEGGQGWRGSWGRSERALLRTRKRVAVRRWAYVCLPGAVGPHPVTGTAARKPQRVSPEQVRPNSIRDGASSSPGPHRPPQHSVKEPGVGGKVFGLREYSCLSTRLCALVEKGSTFVPGK